MLACYIAACLLVGSVYIALGALRVPQEVMILGSTRAVAGQPWVLLAQIDTKQPLTEATLQIEHPPDPPISETFQFHNSLRAEILSRIPAIQSSSLAVSLSAPNSWIHSLPVSVELVPAQALMGEVSVRLIPENPSPLDVSWVPAGGKLVSFFKNTIHIRVLDTKTGLPVPNARVLWTRAYGEASAEGSTDLTADAFGLATLYISPERSSVWDIVATDDQGLRSTALKRQLEPWPAAPYVQVLDAGFAPGQDLAVHIDSLRSGTVYADLWLNGALLERWTLTKPEGTLFARLPTARLNPLDQPALAALMVCWTAAGCGEDYSLTPLLWTPSKAAQPAGAATEAPLSAPALSKPQIMTALEAIAARHPDAAEAAFAALCAAQIKAQGDAISDEQAQRALAFVRGRWSELTPAPSLELVLDSGPKLDAELVTLRRDTKLQLNGAFAVLAVGGGLLLAGWMLGLSIQRQRALAAELADTDTDLLTASAKRMVGWVWVIEVAMSVAVLGGLMWGVYLGLQHL